MSGPPRRTRAREARLVELVGVQHPDVSRVAAGVTSALLGHDDEAAYASSLSNDGSPLQICITSSGGVEHVQLIADPASARRETLSPATPGASRRGGWPRADGSTWTRTRPVLGEVLRGLASDDIAAAPRLRRRMMWIGAPLAGPKLALYVMRAWDEPARDAGADRLRGWPPRASPRRRGKRRCPP